MALAIWGPGMANLYEKFSSAGKDFNLLKYVHRLSREQLELAVMNLAATHQLSHGNADIDIGEMINNALSEHFSGRISCKRLLLSQRVTA